MSTQVTVVKAGVVHGMAAHLVVGVVDIDGEVRVQHATIALQSHVMVFAKRMQVKECLVLVMVVGMATLATVFKHVSVHLELIGEIITAGIS